MKSRYAVYRVYAADNTLLYIGVSGDFGRRWIDHAKLKPWWPLVRRQTIDWHDTLKDAMRAETEAIAAECPVYNVAGQKGPRWHAVELSQILSSADAKLLADSRLPEALRQLSRDVADYLSFAGQGPREDAYEVSDPRHERMRQILEARGDRGARVRDLVLGFLSEGTVVPRETIHRWLAADESLGLVVRSGPPRHRWVQSGAPRAVLSRERPRVASS